MQINKHNNTFIDNLTCKDNQYLIIHIHIHIFYCKKL